MIVRDILTKFRFNVDEANLNKINSGIEAIKNRLSFLSGVEIAKGLYHLAERFGAVGEEIKIASEAAGLSVENFQKLAFAAAQNGVSQEDLSRSLGLLAQNLFKARTGSAEAQRAFSLAGITPQQVASFRNSEDALLALSNVLRAEQDPIKRAALSRELLGRGSRRMAEFLNQGSGAIQKQAEQAKKLGLVLSGGQIKALVDVEHAFGRLFATMKAWASTIAAYISPVVIKMVDDFLELFGANKKLIDLNVEGFLLKFSYGLGFLSGVVEVVVKKFRELASPETLSIFFEAGKLVTGVWALSKAFEAVKASIAGISALINPLVATALLLYTLLHEIYYMKKGEVEKTYGYQLGQAFDKTEFGGRVDAYVRSGGGAALAPSSPLPFVPGQGSPQSGAAPTVNTYVEFNGLTHDDAIDKLQTIMQRQADALNSKTNQGVQGAITR